jgi:hypothetical protein
MVGKVQTAGLVLLGLELACGFLHAPVLQQKAVSSTQSAISSVYGKPSAGMARADKWRLRAEVSHTRLTWLLVLGRFG